MIKKSPGQKWRAVVVRVKNAESQKDKEIGENLFIDILKSLPLLAIKRRNYILKHFQKYLNPD